MLSILVFIIIIKSIKYLIDNIIVNFINLLNFTNDSRTNHIFTIKLTNQNKKKGEEITSKNVKETEITDQNKTEEEIKNTENLTRKFRSRYL